MICTKCLQAVLVSSGAGGAVTDDNCINSHKVGGNKIRLYPTWWYGMFYKMHTTLL